MQSETERLRNEAILAAIEADTERKLHLIQLGLRVEAAAERDGPEREAMANAIYFADRMGHEARERAAEGARALIEMRGK